MKKRELYMFYSTLTVPIGVAAGFAIGGALGSLTVPVFLGVGAGCGAAYLMLRWSAPAEHSR